MNKSTLLNAGIIVAVAFFVGWCSRDPSIEQWRAKYGLYRDSVNLVIRQATAAKKVIDSLSAEALRDSLRADSLQKKASRLATSVATLHAVNDSLRKEIPADLSSCDSIKVCSNMHQLVNGLSAEVDSLNKQNAQLTLSYQTQVTASGKLAIARDSAVARAERAENQLAKLPASPPREKLLFIPLPSRTASFFLGAGMTAVGALVASHVHLH